MAIPVTDKVNIKSTRALKALEGFDPKTAYAVPEGNPNNVRLMKKEEKQREMGVISNLITDMTLRGADEDELARAVKHSMVVIDAEKHKKSAPGEMSAATSRPARTPEAQENYMINLAMKLVEKRLLEGTASSAETTHFLKLATSKNELEKTKLEEENKLLRAKTETLQNAKHSEEMYEKAIAAMKKYNGLGEDDEYDGI